MSFDNALLDKLIAKYLKDKGYSNAYDGFVRDLDKLPGFEKNDVEQQADLASIFSSIQGFMSLPEKSESRAEFVPKCSKPNVIQSFKSASGFVVDLTTIGSNIVVSTADKVVRVYTTNRELLHEIPQLHGTAPVRAVREFSPAEGRSGEHLMVSGGMNGSLIVSDLTGQILASDLKAHSRFICDVDVCGPYIVTAGFDCKIKVYEYSSSDKSLTVKASLDIAKSPTSVRFIPAKNTKELPKIVFGRKESSRLFVYPFDLEESVKKEYQLWEAEYGSYIATFSPLYIAVDTTRRRLAVATDHMPYGRILVLNADTGDILSNMTSMAPQDMYSTPYLAWSHDGRGIWSAGDDGTIRGLDVATGQIVAEINAHGNKVKALAVLADGQLVSGGADRTVLMWDTN